MTLSVNLPASVKRSETAQKPAANPCAKIKETAPKDDSKMKAIEAQEQALKSKLANLKAEYTQAKNMVECKTYTKEQKLQFLKEQHPVKNAVSKGGLCVMAAGGIGVFAASMFCPPFAILGAVVVTAAGAGAYLCTESSFNNDVKKISDEQIKNFYRLKADGLSKEIEKLERTIARINVFF